MDSDRQREIASKGAARAFRPRSVPSQDRELASEAGRKGGQASGGTRSNQNSSSRAFVPKGAVPSGGPFSCRALRPGNRQGPGEGCSCP